MTNIKLYEDGDRLIISIESPDSSVKDLIKGMFSTVTQNTEKITNVAPPPRPIEDKPPVLPNTNIYNHGGGAMNIVEETTRLIQEQAYKGFLAAYINYNSKCRTLKDEEKIKVKEIILNYQAVMKNRNVTEIPDEELKEIICLGAEKVYKTTINNCMKECNVLSMKDFLESGRKNLEYAYKSCFQTK